MVYSAGLTLIANTAIGLLAWMTPTVYLTLLVTWTVVFSITVVVDAAV